MASSPPQTRYRYYCAQCDTYKSERPEGMRCVRCGNGVASERYEADAAEILDACCGGRMWWWDKEHPLALYLDARNLAPGARADRPNWEISPDVVGDFRELPFEDEAFQLVLFDPPHIVRRTPSGNVATQYGALHPDTEQDDLRRGFVECWRVLTPGGTLVFKWAGALDRVEPHFPAPPIVGTRNTPRGSLGLGTRWVVFYKPLTREAITK